MAGPHSSWGPLRTYSLDLLIAHAYKCLKTVLGLILLEAKISFFGLFCLWCFCLFRLLPCADRFKIAQFLTSWWRIVPWVYFFILWVGNTLAIHLEVSTSGKVSLLKKTSKFKRICCFFMPGLDTFILKSASKCHLNPRPFEISEAEFPNWEFSP